MDLVVELESVRVALDEAVAVAPELVEGGRGGELGGQGSATDGQVAGVDAEVNVVLLLRLLVGGVGAGVGGGRRRQGRARCGGIDVADEIAAKRDVPAQGLGLQVDLRKKGRLA